MPERLRDGSWGDRDCAVSSVLIFFWSMFSRFSAGPRFVRAAGRGKPAPVVGFDWTVAMSLDLSENALVTELWFGCGAGRLTGLAGEALMPALWFG